MDKTRICCIDNTSYEYCPRCGKSNPNEKWRFLYCSEDCKELDRIVREYKNKTITIEKANEELKKIKVPATSNVQATVDEIMAYIKPVIEPVFKKKEKKKWDDVEPVIDVEMVNE